MIPGRDTSTDEQTVGFQGHHADKKRNNEKNEVDGFQCDSLNIPGGYTWVFYFRNQPAPPKYAAVGVCPLHACTISLIEQITHKYDCVYMDNMYLLAKLCLLTWKYTEGQIHG